MRARRPLRLVAAHLDHALDDGSAARAAAAASLASALDVPFHGERRTVAPGGDGIEAAARTARYAFLEEVRRSMIAATSSPRITSTTKPKRSRCASARQRPGRLERHPPAPRQRRAGHSRAAPAMSSPRR
jgi:hypothetical protein